MAVEVGGGGCSNKIRRKREKEDKLGRRGQGEMSGMSRSLLGDHNRGARTRLRLSFFSPLIMSLLLVPRLSGFVGRRPITSGATEFAETVGLKLALIYEFTLINFKPLRICYITRERETNLHNSFILKGKIVNIVAKVMIIFSTPQLY